MQVELLAERKRSCNQEPLCRQRNLTSGSAGGSGGKAAAGDEVGGSRCSLPNFAADYKAKLLAARIEEWKKETPRS